MLNTLSNNKKLKNYYESKITEAPILLSDNFNCEYKLNCPYIDFKSPVHILRDNEILQEKVEQYEISMASAANEIEELKDKIKEEIESVLGLVVEVKLVEPKTIERSMGKAKRVIDKRKM